MAIGLDLRHWQPISQLSFLAHLGSYLKLFLWFTWPVGILSLWGLWKWRRLSIKSLHILLPLSFVLLALGFSFFTDAKEKALLLALPSMAILAAFTLPTLKRHGNALLDWFSVFFFTLLAMTLWTFWISLHFGIPIKPAQNIYKLASGYIQPTFAWSPIILAIATCIAWIGLTYWRTSRYRKPLWKSMVLPCSGMILAAILLTTLFMPLLNYMRGGQSTMQHIAKIIPENDCVQVYGFNRPTLAAWQLYRSATHPIQRYTEHSACKWLLVQQGGLSVDNLPLDSEWKFIKTIRRQQERKDRRDDILVFYQSG
jgi:glucan phosphoethanolaminetransferase (alkaline phosphatase superfamily)